MRQLVCKIKLSLFLMQIRVVRLSRSSPKHTRRANLTSAKSQGMRPAPCIARRRERKPVCRWHAPHAGVEKSQQQSDNLEACAPLLLFLRLLPRRARQTQGILYEMQAPIGKRFQALLASQSASFFIREASSPFWHFSHEELQVLRAGQNALRQ